MEPLARSCHNILGRHHLAPNISRLLGRGRVRITGLRRSLPLRWLLVGLVLPRLVRTIQAMDTHHSRLIVHSIRLWEGIEAWG